MSAFVREPPDPPTATPEMKVPWSIEAELCKLAEVATVEAALPRIGLADLVERCQLIERKPWHRSGGETYSYVFSVMRTDRPIHLRLKACAAYSPIFTLNEILSHWVDRRCRLAEAGATTPRLYCAKNGVILEEEIPYSMPDAFRRGNKPEILRSLITAARAYANLGFAPIQGFGDVRSHGNDAVLIDFGSELGPPHVRHANPETILFQLFQQLTCWNVDLSASDRDYIKMALHQRRLTVQ